MAENEENRAPDIAAAVLLKELGYEVDAGGPLYFAALTKFLMSASIEERKKAETPEGLLLVLRRRLDAKKNAEAAANPPSMKFIIGVGIAAAALIFLANRAED